MNHPQPPETSEKPLATGERLPRTELKDFSPEAVREIQSIAAKYPDKLAATLPALHIAQRDFGFVGLDAMKAVAKALSIPEGHVFGVASFYSMYQKHPVGRHHIQVCTNISCALRGAAKLLEQVAERTGVAPGAGPTEDGMWSVEEVECLASCGSGPCLQVNHDVYDEDVNEARLEAILEGCRRGEYREWAK